MKAIVWLLNPHVFAAWRDGSDHLQRLLKRWGEDLRTRELVPVIYVQQPETPAGAGLIALLGDLGFLARSPDPSDGAVVLAHQRADGVVVTALAGERHAAGRSAVQWHAELNRRRQQARNDGRTALANELDKAEHYFLEQRLAPLRPKASRAVEWAPRLRALLQGVLDGDDERYRALLDHLQQRVAHVVIIADAETRCIEFKAASDGSRIIEVYPDLVSAREALAARDPNVGLGTGDLSTTQLFQWMAEEGAGVALRRESPDAPQRLVHIGPEVVRVLCLTRER